MTRLNGWHRLALVFSVIWIACLVAILAYERLVTIGTNTEGPWMLFRNYGGLFFFHVETGKGDFSFWLDRARFWTALLLPLALAWIIAVFIIPMLRWVRAGFDK